MDKTYKPSSYRDYYNQEKLEEKKQNCEQIYKLVINNNITIAEASQEIGLGSQYIYSYGYDALGYTRYEELKNKSTEISKEKKQNKRVNIKKAIKKLRTNQKGSIIREKGQFAEITKEVMNRNLALGIIRDVIETGTVHSQRLGGLKNKDILENIYNFIDSPKLYYQLTDEENS